MVLAVFSRAATEVEQRIRDGLTGTLKEQFCAVHAVIRISNFPCHLSSHRFDPYHQLFLWRHFSQIFQQRAPPPPPVGSCTKSTATRSPSLWDGMRYSFGLAGACLPGSCWATCLVGARRERLPVRLPVLDLCARAWLSADEGRACPCPHYSKKAGKLAPASHVSSWCAIRDFRPQPPAIF
jgi:hypothetical protein